MRSMISHILIGHPRVRTTLDNCRSMARFATFKMKRRSLGHNDVWTARRVRQECSDIDVRWVARVIVCVALRCVNAPASDRCSTDRRWMCVGVCGWCMHANHDGGDLGTHIHMFLNGFAEPSAQRCLFHCRFGAA